MHLTQIELRISTIALALYLFSACDTGTASDTTSDVAISRTETQVNAIDGAVWMTCALGQTWNESNGTCAGEPSAVPCEKTADACPEGFNLPTKNNFKNAMCGLVGSEDTVCPNDRFMPCSGCDVCKELFGKDVGMYTVREGTVHDDMYVGDVVDFKTGCATDDGYPDTLCNVRCVKSEQDLSTDTDTAEPLACEEATTGESCEAKEGCMSLEGDRLDEAQHCISESNLFLGCVPSTDCDDAEGYARSPDNGECYRFPSLCFPVGWSESEDCVDLDAALCEPK
jgi:hypothetical protein